MLALALFGTGTGAQERLRLIRADLLENEVRNGEPVRILSGNVEFQQGDVSLSSDRVSNYTSRGEWLFEGDVKIVDPVKDLRADFIRYRSDEGRFYLRGNLSLRKDGAELYADRAVYYPDRKFYSCAGNVRYESEGRTVRADSADFHETANVMDAFGNVRYRNEEDRIRLNGNYGRFISDSSYGLVTGNPSISFSDTASGEITWIYGEIMEYFGKENNLRIREKVRVNRESLSAVADTAWYFRDSGNARLTGNPKIYDRGKTITADEVLLVFEDNAVRRLEAEGGAHAEMVPDSASGGEINELDGSVITIDFSGDDVSRMRAERNAVCRYYAHEAGASRGANVVTGSAITISFAGGDIDAVLVEGGSEGTYFPPSLIGLAGRKSGGASP